MCKRQNLIRTRSKFHVNNNSEFEEGFEVRLKNQIWMASKNFSKLAVKYKMSAWLKTDTKPTQKSNHGLGREILIFFRLSYPFFSVVQSPCVWEICKENLFGTSLVILSQGCQAHSPIRHSRPWSYSSDEFNWWRGFFIFATKNNQGENFSKLRGMVFFRVSGLTTHISAFSPQFQWCELVTSLHIPSAVSLSMAWSGVRNPRLQPIANNGET